MTFSLVSLVPSISHGLQPHLTFGAVRQSCGLWNNRGLLHRQTVVLERCFAVVLAAVLVL